MAEQTTQNDSDVLEKEIMNGDVFSSYATEQERTIRKIEFNKKLTKVITICTMILPVVSCKNCFFIA